MIVVKGGWIKVPAGVNGERARRGLISASCIVSLDLEKPFQPREPHNRVDTEIGVVCLGAGKV